MTIKGFLFKYLKKYWHFYLAGVFTLLIVDVAQLYIPKVIAYVIDRLEALDMTIPQLYKYGGIIVLLAIIMSLMRFLWRQWIILTGFRIARDIRQDLMRKMYRLPVSFYTNNKVGNLMANVINDVDAIRFFLGMGVIALFDMSILSSMAIGFMLMISPKLTLIALIPAPFIFILMYYFEGPLQRKFLSIQELFGKMSEKVKETIEGIALIKLYRLYGLKKSEFKSLNIKYRKDNMITSSIDALFRPVIEFLMMVTLAIILYYGGIQVIDEKVSLGDFVAFTRYINILIWPMIALGWVFSLFQRAISGMKRLFVIFEADEEQYNCGSDIEKFHDGKLEMNNVNFTYDNSNFTLENINIKIPEKSLVGITGKIGCGKSTLVNLFLRLFEIDSGEIKIGEDNIQDYSLRTLRTNIAYVPQETFLFSSSILDNLRFADENASIKDVEKALEIARALDFVKNLPQGIDTVVGERGVSLSGGQKQRISLARALLLKRPIIIMDDCLSAVDSETERSIIQNLRDKWSQSTSIVVSHRLSAFQYSDMVFVMDQGRIVDVGTHDELKEHEGIYNSLYLKQQIEEELENA